MSESPVNTLLANIERFQYNPSAIQRAVLSLLDTDVVDPTNPFCFALESSAVSTAAFMMKCETKTRFQYPYSAQNEEELYPHMSDQDFINRFASPATTRFSILLPFEETLNKMVEDPLTGIRKIVIPRNTFFTIANTVFSLQYPIEIRQLQHGGLQALYDASIVSPLQTLETNAIELDLRHSVEGSWIYFEVDVQQFSIISQFSTLNAAADFRMDIAFEDQFYYARVYVENAQGNWDEIRTTHTDQIYDPNVPTAVLRVIENKVTVMIPQIYTNTHQLNQSVRVDVYQTKGPIDMILWEYPMNAFGVTWMNYDKTEDTIFTAPVKTLRSFAIYSDKTVVGGSNALTFEELRDRVIRNAIGPQHLPITNVQIATALDQKGYQVVKNIDTVTNRVFLAARSMPEPTDTSLITAAAASIETVNLSLKNAVALTSVIDNGDSITITPDTLYQNVDGVTRLVPSEEVTSLLAMPAETRALLATNNKYLYSPFHYVLDASDNEFEARAYYLDDPTIETKIFVAENDTTLIQVGTASYGILRTPTGYVIQVVTASGDSYKELDDDDCFVQLAFVPAGEKDRAYLNGVFAGKTDDGERIFNFDLSTNFEVNKAHNLMLSQFLLYTTEPRLTATPLTNDFDIIYSTSAPLGPTWRADDIDRRLGNFLLPNRIAGISHEKLRVRFGHALKTLWTRSRSVISSVTYKTWEMDVPRYYEEDIYERDINGSAIKFDEENRPYVTILHYKGDPVLDAEGNQVYQHRKGDVMLDDFGNPVPTDERGMIRQVDIMLVEGVYWFATDLSTVTYRTTMTHTIVDWLMNDLATMTKQLLEQTRLYFYPKTTLGSISVMVEDGVVRTIEATQAFVVDLYVSGSVYANAALRDRLTKTTIRTINDALKKVTVSTDGILTDLRKQYGNDVISAKLAGLGGLNELQALTIMDESDRCSLRKRLVALANDTLVVEEDVTVNFIRHEVTL